MQNKKCKVTFILRIFFFILNILVQDSISSYVEVEKAKLKEEEAKILQEEELLEKEMSELKEKVRSLSIST